MFTVRTLVFTVHDYYAFSSTFYCMYISFYCTLLIITYLQFTVFFTDRVFTLHYYVNTVQVLFTDYCAFISTFYCTYISFYCTLLIIRYLQYLLLLTEVLFTVFFTDRVFTVYYFVNTVQVLFTDYYALHI